MSYLFKLLMAASVLLLTGCHAMSGRSGSDCCGCGKS